LVSEKYIRIPTSAVDPKAKNFHWADMKQSLFEARDHGKDMSVLPDADGYLTEAPGANVFLIKNGALYTPGSGCLEGITRKTVLELATLIGIPAHVEKVHAKQLRDADEAFITSSAGGVMPINSVDGNVLGGIEGPGELTVRLHNLYWEKLWEGWKATPVDYEGLTIQPRAVSSASSGAAG
jgi:branched-chain amino acid aminotransferase